MILKIDIISGFLGAGKTTLIKKLLKEKLYMEKVVLLENEFGEVSIDSAILRDSAIEIKEINSGCICCSLQGDFVAALEEIMDQLSPHRILIEPTGVGKLSDIVKAIERFSENRQVVLNAKIVVVDCQKYELYINNFGEFYLDQIKNASTILLSKTDLVDCNNIDNIVKSVHNHNSLATIITSPWDKISSEQILSIAEKDMINTADKEDLPHHHAHNHSANNHFENWTMQSSSICNIKNKIAPILKELEDKDTYGLVVRAKGIIPVDQSSSLQFDFVSGEQNLQTLKVYSPMGRIAVIGVNLNKKALAELFLVTS